MCSPLYMFILEFNDPLDKGCKIDCFLCFLCELNSILDGHEEGLIRDFSDDFPNNIVKTAPHA